MKDSDWRLGGNWTMGEMDKMTQRECFKDGNSGTQKKWGSTGQGAIKKKDNSEAVPECSILGGVGVGGSYNADMFVCGGG